jgi:integrase
LRPTVKVLKGSPDETTWSETDDATLIDLVLPESPRNIFSEDLGTRKRNYLLIQILRCLGKRRGEVLNIQRGDIKPQKNQLDIIRRPDAKVDARVVQPKVKTREHTLAIDPELTKLILDYLTYRREVPGANKNPYLFVNHKAGPTQGKAMTVGALYEVFRTIKNAAPSLKNLHPHLLRHNFNYQMSQTFDSRKGERNLDQEKKVRAHANGWSPQSKMAEKYNERHTAEAGREAGLDIQKNLLKVMKFGTVTSSKESEHDE